MTDEIYEFTITPQMERYYNEENNWGVYTFTTEDDIPQSYAVKNDDFFNAKPSEKKLKGSSLVGKMQRLQIGNEYKVKAKVAYNEKYKTFNYIPEIITSDIPKTYEQQAKFLQTITTDLQAKNILAEYPNVVEDVMHNNPIDISRIKGIGEKIWNDIKDKIMDTYVVSDILVMLQPLGVSYGIIKKLISSEPNPSLLKQQLLDNPYIMTRVDGLGFKKVDDLALKLNPAIRITTKRVYAYIKYFFTFTGENDGHTWVNEGVLENAVRDNINECFDIYTEIIANEKKKELFLHFDGEKVGLKNRHISEMNVLSILDSIDNSDSQLKVDIESGISLAEQEQGFCFTDEQKENILNACKSNVVLISGLAGTGKTSILRGLLKIYRYNSIGCCALSAKAAQRITEATANQATTIHRMLGFNGMEFLYNADNRLPFDIVVVDESSMVNVPIFLSLLVAIKEGAKLILCGDDGQLPPIGYGNVFHDLLELNRYNSCKLTKILRQAEKSGIISDSKKIRNNENPLSQPELKVTSGELQDMTYMFRDNREGIRDLAINLYFKTVENNSIDDTIIITPCKKDRTNSTEEINKIIMNKLLPDAVSISFGTKEFRVGAKVIQRANNYNKNVFNGEIGYVTDIGKRGKTNTVTVDFDGKIIVFSQGELATLELAYALTVHVTQGSGYKNVIVIIDNTHFKLLDSCLLYTALTRAKKKCLLISEPTAFQRCINYKASERQTWLSILDNSRIK